MRKNAFFLKSFIMLVCFIFLDKGLGRLLHHFYFKIQHGEQARMTYAIDSCLAETVILGSSRAAHHYVSPIIGKILNTSCYNAGKDKQRLRYCFAMLNMMYRRYSPRQIILDLNPTALEMDENGLDELSDLLPYYDSHPEIRSIVNERNRFEYIKTYSDLYCYNSLPLKIIFNNLSNKRDINEAGGYVPLLIQKEIIPDTPENLLPASPIDAALVNYFKSMIKLTKEHHSKLYVVISPIYNHIPNDFQSVQLAKAICEKEKIPFLDYSQSPIFLKHGPEMFLDIGHLNDSSAAGFSTLLANDMKTIQMNEFIR